MTALVALAALLLRPRDRHASLDASERSRNGALQDALTGPPESHTDA
jgi:hypothetical protein